MESEVVVTYGEKVLRAQASEVAEFDDSIRRLIERMYVIMTESRGVGLAAPQIGLSLRLFVYDIGEGQHAMVNPTIVSSSGEESGLEGCLSIPGLQGEVTRADRLTVTGIDENGQRVRIKAQGFLARVFQHEIDHLDGRLFIDRADPDTLETVPLTADDDEGDTERAPEV